MKTKIGLIPACPVIWINLHGEGLGGPPSYIFRWKTQQVEENWQKPAGFFQSYHLVSAPGSAMIARGRKHLQPVAMDWGQLSRALDALAKLGGKPQQQRGTMQQVGYHLNGKPVGFWGTPLLIKPWFMNPGLALYIFTA